MGIPWFVVGFFALAAVNSIGLVPEGVAGTAERVAAALLAAAVTATAIRSPLAQLLETGPRPILVIAGATLTALMLAAGAAASLL